MIHPTYFRKGIAEQLLCFIEEYEYTAKKVIVSTGSKNFPAIHLYKKCEYFKKGERQVTERLTLTVFEKVLR
ncbi:N-acetyltransferase [Sporosarcina sp. PTS2304]|uniref:GNAT family N-acetyltransferase n=1 Tax=Sporosarcina sp. PTS2304 TaxID=2283194 RepID=UPI001F085B5D|nr:GNAT family N-acetyltransferase [Sporosarcina sp. PTS2304]